MKELIEDCLDYLDYLEKGRIRSQESTQLWADMEDTSIGYNKEELQENSVGIDLPRAKELITQWVMASVKESKTAMIYVCSDAELLRVENPENLTYKHFRGQYDFPVTIQED